MQSINAIHSEVFSSIQKEKLIKFHRFQNKNIFKLKKNCIATHENQTFINIDLKMPNQKSKRKLIN